MRAPNSSRPATATPAAKELGQTAGPTGGAGFGASLGRLARPCRSGPAPLPAGAIDRSAGRAAWSLDSREARENPSQSLNIGSPAALRAGERVTAPIHHAGEPHPHAPACRRSPHGPHEGRGGRREQPAPRKSQRTVQGQGGIEGRRRSGSFPVAGTAFEIARSRASANAPARTLFPQKSCNACAKMFGFLTE